MRRKASRESRGVHAEHGIGGQRACTVVGNVKLVGFVRVGAEVVGCGGDADDDGCQDTGGRIRWGLCGGRGGACEAHSGQKLRRQWGGHRRQGHTMQQRSR